MTDTNERLSQLRDAMTRQKVACAVDLFNQWPSEDISGVEIASEYIRETIVGQRGWHFQTRRFSWERRVPSVGTLYAPPNSHFLVTRPCFLVGASVVTDSADHSRSYSAVATLEASYGEVVDGPLFQIAGLAVVIRTGVLCGLPSNSMVGCKLVRTHGSGASTFREVVVDFELMVPFFV